MISTLDGLQGASDDEKASHSAADKALVLALFVDGCTPPIWRRLVVLESMWLNHLHDTIQVALDWFDYQTHEFVIGEARYGNPFKRGEITVEDDRDVTLADIGLERTGSMGYMYHFGEGWSVSLRVESVVPFEKGKTFPVCVGGERAGPPEDCGGVEAFQDMLECIKEPHTELGQEWIEWLGPDYDPEKCDLDEINKALKERAKSPDKKNE